VVAAGLIAAPAAAQPTRNDVPTDAFGYQLLGPDDPACPYGFTDVAAGGTALGFTAAGAADAEDDGGAAVPLADDFELYGLPVPGLIVSTNGYLAVGADLGRDDGGDYSNDARLPALPGEEDRSVLGDEPRSAARLMVYHDDLSAATTGGTAYYEHFASCPRPADSGLDEACTVFQWDGWGYAGGADAFTFQALLYHTSYEIVFQAAAGDPSQGAGATFGIQDAGSTAALQHRGPLPAGSALCFFEPRFPATGPAADLAIALSDGQDTVEPGAVVEYTLEVRHVEGPSPAPGATVSDDFPDALTDCTWTCTPAAGASCTEAGSGDLADVADLPEDGAVTYVATCRVATDASGPLVNVAAVALPAGYADPTPGDNTASDNNAVAGTLIFADGFESGDSSGWSGP
jgi:hypothetical protein